jgi:hypothetical protein
VRPALSIEPEPGRPYHHDVLPLFEIDPSTDPPSIDAFRGTSFLISDFLLVTCWHCVRDVREGRILVVGSRRNELGEPVDREGADWRLDEVVSISQDTNGFDLATGRVTFRQGPAALSLAPQSLATGADVWSYGYPFTTPQLHDDRKRWNIEARYLEGYITRAFWREVGERSIPTYELDMLAPSGISGAPLLDARTGTVCGGVHGSLETTMAETALDPLSGDAVAAATPRYFAFAGAHFTSSLHDLAGDATEQMPLSVFLAEGGVLPPEPAD